MEKTTQVNPMSSQDPCEGCQLGFWLSLPTPIPALAYTHPHPSVETIVWVRLHCQCLYASVCFMLNRLIVFDTLRPHGLQPARLLCPWNFFQGKNIREDCHFSPPGDLPDPGIELAPPTSPALKAHSLTPEPWGKPWCWERLKAKEEAISRGWGG